MASFDGYMVHPHAGIRQPVYEGFSWPCFFFTGFWYAFKGLWGMFWFLVFIAIFSYGVGPILLSPFLAAFANGKYREHLAMKGYVYYNQHGITTGGVK